MLKKRKIAECTDAIRTEQIHGKLIPEEIDLVREKQKITPTSVHDATPAGLISRTDVPSSPILESVKEPSDVGKRVRAARELLKLTQKELANKLSVSYSNIQQYEAGQTWPGSRFLQSLCQLGVNGHWLLTGHGEILSVVGQGEAAGSVAPDQLMQALHGYLRSQDSAEGFDAVRPHVGIIRELLDLVLFNGQSNYQTAWFILRVLWVNRDSCPRGMTAREVASAVNELKIKNGHTRISEGQVFLVLSYLEKERLILIDESEETVSPNARIAGEPLRFRIGASIDGLVLEANSRFEHAGLAIQIVEALIKRILPAVFFRTERGASEPHGSLSYFSLTVSAGMSPEVIKKIRAKVSKILKSFHVDDGSEEITYILAGGYKLREPLEEVPSNGP